MGRVMSCRYAHLGEDYEEDEWGDAGRRIEREEAHKYGTVPGDVLMWAVQTTDEGWKPGDRWDDQAVTEGSEG